MTTAARIAALVNSRQRLQWWIEIEGIRCRYGTTTPVWAPEDVTPDEEDDMSSFFHLVSGTAMPAIGKEPVVDESGMQYPDDEVEHRASWIIYVPVALRTGHTLVERLVFHAEAAGTAKISIGITPFNESGADTFDPDLVVKDVAIPAAPDSMVAVDVDLTEYIDANVTHLMIGLSRDSSVSGDNLAKKLVFLNGYLVE